MDSRVYEQFLGALNSSNDKKSVKKLEKLVDNQNTEFFEMLNWLNELLNSTNSEPVLVTAAGGDKYYFAAKLHILGCNSLKDQNGKHPFDCLSKEQQENVSRCIRMLSDEMDKRNRCKFKKIYNKNGSNEIVIEKILESEFIHFK